jgi:2-polyprenyl-3-methyl-5-hydroxy-6-metoxy-1,4-benzoquinol methylase
MKLIERLLRRSGELVFDAAVDGSIDMRPEPRHAWLQEWIGTLKAARVVDVGCWTGALLTWALGEGCVEVAGIDLPGPWLKTASRRAPGAAIYPVRSLSDVPSSLKSRFDFVFFMETLEHLPRGSETAALAALRQLLVPGGWLVLSTPIAGVMNILDPAWFLVGHRHYSVSTIQTMLSAAGFQSEEVRWSGNLWSAIATNLLYIEKHLLRRQPRSHPWLERRDSRGLGSQRSLTSTNVWVRAVATQ